MQQWIAICTVLWAIEKEACVAAITRCSGRSSGTKKASSDNAERGLRLMDTRDHDIGSLATDRSAEESNLPTLAA